MNTYAFMQNPSCPRPVLVSIVSKQVRLLSDWLICFPSTQTLFEHALLKILKTKMASERAISC